METNSKKSSLKVVLIVIATGIWSIVLQNAGIIPTSQKVEVTNRIRGSVEVDNTVDVNGSVDVNIEAINGHSDVFFNNTSSGESNKYYRLPVVTFGY